VLASLVELAAAWSSAHPAAPAVPVFGSGDVWTPADARRMLAETGAAGVLFARGALGNPGVFSATRALLTGAPATTTEPAMTAAMEELLLLIADEGEQRACVNMRKRFAAYLHGMPGAASLRAAAVRAETLADYKKIAAMGGQPGAIDPYK
jgi:tRNA-dihydrouridine synthase